MRSAHAASLSREHNRNGCGGLTNRVSYVHRGLGRRPAWRPAVSASESTKFNRSTSLPSRPPQTAQQPGKQPRRPSHALGPAASRAKGRRCLATAHGVAEPIGDVDCERWKGRRGGSSPSERATRPPNSVGRICVRMGKHPIARSLTTSALAKLARGQGGQEFQLGPP